MNLFHRSHFDSDCGCSPSWPNCVSGAFSNSAFGISHFSHITAAFAIITGVFHENKGRTWSHATNIAAMRYLFGQNWDIRTLRSFLGVTTSQVYQNWARGEKQEVLTDILAEGAKLHWIGQRRDGTQDRVFLYFHGELNPASSTMLF
jgi:hypothetical protein